MNCDKTVHANTSLICQGHKLLKAERDMRLAQAMLSLVGPRMSFRGRAARLLIWAVVLLIRSETFALSARIVSPPSFRERLRVWLGTPARRRFNRFEGAQ